MKFFSVNFVSIKGLRGYKSVDFSRAARVRILQDVLLRHNSLAIMGGLGKLHREDFLMRDRHIYIARSEHLCPILGNT